MPKSVSRLELAEQHDKEAEEHIRKVIEWEDAARNATTPADRERYGEKVRIERDAAIESLNDARIAFGAELEEAKQDSDPED